MVSGGLPPLQMAHSRNLETTGSLPALPQGYETYADALGTESSRRVSSTAYHPSNATMYRAFPAPRPHPYDQPALQGPSHHVQVPPVHGQAQAQAQGLVHQAPRPAHASARGLHAAESHSMRTGVLPPIPTSLEMARPRARSPVVSDAAFLRPHNVDAADSDLRRNSMHRQRPLETSSFGPSSSSYVRSTRAYGGSSQGLPSISTVEPDGRPYERPSVTGGPFTGSFPGSNLAPSSKDEHASFLEAFNSGSESEDLASPQDAPPGGAAAFGTSLGAREVPAALLGDSPNSKKLRNRTASKKARERRKQWIDGIYKRKEELEAVIASQETEIERIKMEIFMLKSVEVLVDQCQKNH